MDVDQVTKPALRVSRRWGAAKYQYSPPKFIR